MNFPRPPPARRVVGASKYLDRLMASNVTKDSVEAVFRQVLGPEYDPEQSQLRLQSLRMLELVVAIENEFSVSIPEDAPIAKITASVQNVVDYLHRLDRRR